MTWTEIEENWLAMTRRVRPAYGTAAVQSAELLQDAAPLSDTGPDWPAHQPVAARLIP